MASLDRLAARIRDAAPVRFRPSETPPEREAIFRLRARTVIERGWRPARALPDGLERDRFDGDATLIGGWRGTELVAAARLVWPDGAHGTPLQSEFGISPEPPGRVVHLDRMCIARGTGNAGSRLTVALIAACWLTIRQRGYSRFSGIDSASVTRLYHKLGFSLAVLGGPRRYWGEPRFPVVFDRFGGEP